MKNYKDDPRFKPVNLALLQQQYSGSQFAKLIEHHLKLQSQQKRMLGINETIEWLPEKLRPYAMQWIDRWNLKSYEPSFWRRDTADVMTEILLDAKSIMADVGIAYEDETAFNMFQIIVLNFAYNAYKQPKMRKVIGIRFGILDHLFNSTDTISKILYLILFSFGLWSILRAIKYFF